MSATSQMVTVDGVDSDLIGAAQAGSRAGILAQVGESELEPDDWQDIRESDFVDVAVSAMGTKASFIYEHSDLGLHGFNYYFNTKHIEPAAFERQD